MKRIATALFTLSVILLAATGSATTPQTITVTRNLTSMPLAFTENQGQWDEQVLYRANAGGATMWFTQGGAVYQFTRSIEAEELSIVDKRYGMVPDDMMDHQPDSIESIAIKASFVGANPNPRMTGIDAMEYKCNYFIGNDPNEWHTDVPNFGAIVYEDIYTGIDLKYYGNGKQMEYDFIVSPGADYSQIQIQYEGAESISINADGELVVETIWGEVIEQRPVIYQIENNSRISINGEYSLKGDASFGFELSSSYDPALPLVIDPVLVYSTYLGGNVHDNGQSIAVDGSGNAYITGWTESTYFPTEGEYQTYQGGSDAFVTKLNSSGNGLVYSTYLGGNDDDYGSGIAVDGSGSAYITGITSSPYFPTTPDAYDTSYNGGVDAFVTKLNSSGNDLVYSTYLGGSNNDYGLSIAVDGSGNAYITGWTESTNFPTEGEYQTYQGGSDAFVTKLNSSGNGLVYSTYLGGNGDDRGRDIAVDGSGNAYVTGNTSSFNFPTQGEYQTDQTGIDAFVTKLDSSGNGLVYSTYLGGNDTDIGYGIAVDGLGCAYVTGRTESTDFPTEGEYQTHQFYWDAFVTKLNSSGNGLVYSTYLGGINIDVGNSIVVDGSGNAYITGRTQSANFPTEGEYQTHQGGDDVFVTKLNSSGNGLVYSTYLGGDYHDIGYSIAVDGSGNAYITGYTWPNNFPTTPDAYDTNHNGWRDAFVVKFSASEETPSITVLSPNGGEVYDIGVAQNITWSEVVITNNVKIEYTLNAGVDWFPIPGAESIAAGTGSFAWDLDPCIDQHLAASTFCLVKVEEVTASPTSDISDVHFTIQGDGCNCTYWTAGLDTVLYTAFEVELFDPTDSTGSLGTIAAFGANMIVQRSEPYEASPDIWRMDTDILAFSGSGDSPLLGGQFTIDLNPQETSGGYIQMCESCNDRWAESHFDIKYRINTSLPYPENTLYGIALMDLSCDEQWDPFPPGGGPFTPPNGYAYDDPRKLPILNANGDTIAFTTKQHSVDEDPFGSCCVIDANQVPVTSACLIVTEAECEAAGGVYSSDNSICDPTGEDTDDDGIGDACDPICCAVRGDVDHTDGAIDISDLVYLVDYMFNGGPTPPCIDEANVDGADEIDISDLVYLVDYMFTGGPPPLACP